MEQVAETNQNPAPSEHRPLPPRRMNRRAIVLAIALFAVIVAGMFIFAFIGQDRENEGQTTDENEMDQRYANITRIDGKHFYIDGVHTIVGEVAMPTPCDLLESSARVAESMPEQITLEFSVVNNAEFCAQMITPQRFKVSASASEEASFSAVFEGRPIELNLVEAEEGETPEEFELFIKG